MLKQGLEVEPDSNAPGLSLELVRQFAQLTALYWVRWGAWRSWVGLGLYTLYTVLETTMNAYLAKLSGDQLGALSSREPSSFLHLLIWFVIAQLAWSVFSTVLQLPYGFIAIHWQRWLTRQFIDDYLRARNYYLINRDLSIDNPDERIANDIQQFIAFPTTVLFGALKSISGLAVFGVVLAHFRFRLLPACAALALGGSVVTLLLNRPIIKLSFLARKLEGNFRFGLVHVRTHAEAIAMHGGEEIERKELFERNEAIVNNSVKQLCWNTIIRVWYYVDLALTQVLPVLMMAPMYFSGALSLSGFSQARNAWSNVDSAFGFFGTQAWNFANNGAVVNRLAALRRECQAPRSRKHLEEENAPAIRFATSKGSIVAERMSLWAPDGSQLLVNELNLTVGAGDSLLVVGPSGVGKSSLLRGFAGLWTRGSGSLSLPPATELMFLPQRPYCSLGNLREQVAYPHDPASLTDDVLRSLLASVGLDYLEHRFQGFASKLDWEHVLSPGEQQRLAFTRILLRRPRFVILDEATSALDIAIEARLYCGLKEAGSALISVGHRPSIFAYHRSVLELKGAGTWQLSSFDQWSNPLS